MTAITRRILGATAFAALFAATMAAAQAPQITRGTVEKVDGSMVTLKQPSGSDVTVKLLDNAKVFGVKAATTADVKPGQWIGVGAMPQPDGSQKAIQVTIFSEPQRGVGEGFKPWDRPGSTMTNGNADSTVSSVDGSVVVVKYKDGQQKIVIGPDAKVRMYIVGTVADLKPGVQVSIFNPDKAPDGTLQTARINYGIGNQQP